MTKRNYSGQIQSFRQEMEDKLRAPDGWLTLVGLHWLEEGANYLGTDPSNDIVLPGGTAPEHVGVLERHGEEVVVKVDSRVQVSINGSQVQESSLKPDTSGMPTVISVGDLTFFVIIRGSRVGIRVKQEDHPNLLNFTGRDWFQPSKVFRVPAEVIPYNPPKPAQIENVLGDIEDSSFEARLEFKIRKNGFNLDAFRLNDGRFQILFKDDSSGVSSYPAGRYVVTDKESEGQVMIDFNKAYNPPCAFTNFATCPLPPPQNKISLSIQAGEKYTKLAKT